VSSTSPVDGTRFAPVYAINNPERGVVVNPFLAEHKRGWWDSVGKDTLVDDALVYVQLESEATKVRTFKIDLIDGLMQTPEYTAAVMRDSTDFAALEVALRRGIPVLAICRGMQVLSITRGGTLHQHLPTHAPPGPGIFSPREIRVDPDSRLGTAMGSSVILHCHHHQGIDRLGDGLVATAWAADGVVEGLEDPSANFLAGVQAHPEESGTAGLFKARRPAGSAWPATGWWPRRWCSPTAARCWPPSTSTLISSGRCAAVAAATSVS
jgi:anthranilate/para-aminobenzoate synthase component II